MSTCYTRYFLSSLVRKRLAQIEEGDEFVLSRPSLS
jgi:hypothetical protein